MRNGIYSVEFASNLEWGGVGLAVLHNGHIRGGDDEYLYIGKYAPEKPGYVATVEVRRHRGDTGSIFGQIEAFDLELVGTHSDASFLASGSVRGDSALTISLRGHLIRHFSGNHTGPPTSGASAPFLYSDSRRWGSLGSELPFRVVTDCTGVLGEPELMQVRLAKQHFQEGHYGPALCLVCPVIEGAVSEMVLRAGLQSNPFVGLSAQTRLLSDHGILPSDMCQAGEVFTTRNLACHGAIRLPPECVYPLCLLAFLYLDRLITEYNPKPII